MFINPNDVKEVINTVNSCSKKTSTDYDEMSMNLVKEITTDIVKPFTYVCNLSFKSGIFLDKMKVAKVISLFKAGSKNNFTNYRAFSILPQFLKILEKLFDVRFQKI